MSVDVSQCRHKPKLLNLPYGTTKLTLSPKDHRKRKYHWYYHYCYTAFIARIVALSSLSLFDFFLLIQVCSKNGCLPLWESHTVWIHCINWIICGCWKGPMDQRDRIKNQRKIDMFQEIGLLGSRTKSPRTKSPRTKSPWTKSPRTKSPQPKSP